MNTSKPRLLVFASGGAEPNQGGSGFAQLVKAAGSGVLDADIVGVVSNHMSGGVRSKADFHGIHFSHFPAPFVAETYRHFVEEYDPNFIALSGWIKLVRGLDPKITFNIHPGPLPDYGGKGMYGHAVHEAVHRDWKAGKIRQSEVTMHFVTEKYDDGPAFFRCAVPLLPGDLPETIALRVNMFEHALQPFITNMVVNGYISWDGINKASLIVPPNLWELVNQRLPREAL